LDAVLPGHIDLIERWFTGALAADDRATLLAGLRTIRDAVAYSPDFEPLFSSGLSRVSRVG
jgi:hypothetical protein